MIAADRKIAPIAKPKDDSKQQIAYNTIKEAIIKNELLPDTLLVERQLSETMGISRTPIREALRRLSSEGFVESIPDKGMFVSRIRFEDMIEIFELREALEGMAVRLCTLKRDDNIIAQMRECVDEMVKSFAEGNYNLTVEKDMEFHHLYIKGAKNLRLETMLNTVLDQNSRIAFYTISDRERLRNSIDQHKLVLQAVEQDDADDAEKHIKEHIANTKEYHMNKLYFIK